MKTKVLSLLMAVVMLLTVLTVGVSAENLTEIPDGYIGVYTKDDLFAVRENPSGKYILMNNIVFDDADYVNGGDFYNSGKGWEPIGTLSTPFKGTFDGNGYEIVNLQINNPDGDYQGLFGYVYTATLKQVTLVKSNIIGRYYVGSIVGQAEYGSKISNCSFLGIVQGTDVVGGIAGELSVWGDNYGYYSTITIEKCVNTGTIKGDKNIGGIVGRTQSNSSYNSGSTYVYVKNCINSGNVYATNTASGISCDTGYSKVQNCLSVGDVSAENSFPITNGGTTTFCYYLDTSVNGYTGTFGTPKSADQLRKQGTFEQWDFDTVWTMEGREDFPYPELRDVPLVFPDDSKTEISGTVTVKGEAKVGSTLTAEITDISPVDATFEYEWKADGKVVGTDASYTVTQADVGKNITLTVKGNGNFGGNFSSSAIVGECVHSAGEYTNNNDATCDKNETKSAVCEKCNATVTEEIENTKIPHTFINYKYDNNATCTADGTKTAKCENCDATDTVTAENTMVEHTFSDNWVIDKDATCAEEGLKSHHCKNCDATKDETVLNKLAHIYVADVTESTCYEDGKIIYTCSCGDTYSKTLYATGHIDNDDGICDECSESVKKECTCNCHRSGIMIVIWKVIQFFYKLFGINKTCACGVAHW